MVILLKQSRTGLFLAPNGCWTTERSEAQVFKHVRDVVALMPVLDGPLELFYDVGDDALNFTLPLQRTFKKSRAGDSPKPQ